MKTSARYPSCPIDDEPASLQASRYYDEGHRRALRSQLFYLAQQAEQLADQADVTAHRSGDYNDKLVAEHDHAFATILGMLRFSR